MRKRGKAIVVLVAALAGTAAAVAPSSEAHVSAPYRATGPVETANLASILKARPNDGFYVDTVRLPESQLYQLQPSPEQKQIRKTLWRSRIRAGVLPSLKGGGGVITLPTAVAGVPTAFLVGWKIGGAIDSWLGLSGDYGARQTYALEPVQWIATSDLSTCGGPAGAFGYCARTTSFVEFCPAGCVDTRDGTPLRPQWLNQQMMTLPGTVVEVPGPQCGIAQAYHSGTCAKKYITLPEMEARTDVTGFEPFTGQQHGWNTPYAPMEETNHASPYYVPFNLDQPQNEIDTDPSHKTEEWINERIDPTYAPEFTMPQCVGSLVALCISELDEFGHIGTRVITVADFNGADTSKPATAVITQSVPAFTTQPYDVPITIVRNPDPGAMPLIVPQPRKVTTETPPGELFEEFVTRLGLLGWDGPASSTVLTPELADPDLGPNEVVTVTPAPGTRIPPNEPVVIRLNPPDWPMPTPGDPGGGDPADCPCPISSLNFSPLQVENVCTKFPFGVFCWIADQTALLFGAAADAPSFTFNPGAITTELFTIPAGTFAFTVDLAELPPAVEGFIAVTRIALAFGVWLLGLWLMGRRMMQRNDTLDADPPLPESSAL